MAKLRKTQNDFSAGEIAPYSQGRVDVAINYKGAKKILNFIPLIQGGLTRRPATRHIKEAASSSSLNRLIPFIYSTEENFVLNFTHNSVDIVESIDGSEAVVATLETPYSEDDIYNIQYTQSVNVLILVCRGKQPRQITRTGTNWEISTIVFEDGPYFEQNKSETVVTIEDFVDRGVLYCSEPVFTEHIIGSIIEYRYEGDYYLAECISLIDSQNMEVRPIENTLTQVDDRTVLTISTPDSIQIDSSIAIFSNSVVNRHIRVGEAEWITIDEYISTTRVKGQYISNIFNPDSAFLNNNWTSVTYGNGLFVAVSQTGTGNRVMTSPDGINWTARTSAVDNQWYSVTYGDGLFVAVAVSGTGNRVMTSPDGISWTARTSAADNNWNSVTYGNGLFVAVSQTGTGNRVMTSPDGISWTSRTSAADNDWRGINYGNGLFVAVAITGTDDRVMYSDDGITWLNGANVYMPVFVDKTIVLNKRKITASISSNFSLFSETDIGRGFRMRLADTQIYGTISEVDSDTLATVVFDSPIPFSTNPEYEIESEGQTKSWRLGAWSEQYGYPYAVDFDKGRLVFAGNGFYPNRIWASVADDFYRFSPTDLSSVVLDTNAISYDLNSTQANEIRWVIGGRTLMIGTSGNIWSLTPSYFQNSLTPSDIGSNREDPYGAEPIKPLAIESSILYVQRYGYKLRELTYEYQSQGWIGQDLSAVANHLFRETELGQIKDFCFQTEPFTIIWIVTKKGELASLTYSKQYQKYAWARHKLGGDNVFVESICTIPSRTTRQDDVYMVVSRTIGEATYKSLEKLSNEFYPQNNEDYTGSIFQDCYTFYDGPETTTISGLGYLEGQRVCVSIKGGAYSYYTVSGGTIQLPFAATNVAIGLFADAEIEFLPVETVLSEINTTHGYSKAIQQVNVKLWSSMGFELRSNGLVVDTVVTRTAGEYGDGSNSAPDLFSGTVEKHIGLGYEKETNLSIYHNTPTPLSILSTTLSFELSE